MNISGIVVRTRPEALAAVCDALAQFSGAEVHAKTPDGRIVLTLEDAGTARAADTFVRLHDLAGVLSVSLIYQYSDEPEVQEART